MCFISATKRIQVHEGVRFMEMICQVFSKFAFSVEYFTACAVWAKVIYFGRCLLDVSCCGHFMVFISACVCVKVLAARVAFDFRFFVVRFGRCRCRVFGHHSR